MRRRTLALLMLLVAVAGCNDSPPTSNSDGTVPSPDGSSLPPPALTATVPTDGAKSVALDTQLKLTFSRAIDVGTLEVTVEPVVEFGDPAWNGDNTVVTLTPAAALAGGVEHKVSVAAKSPDGQALSGKASFGFTTLSPPPSVRYSNPSAGATDVPPSIMITIGFSKPMDKASVQSAFLSTPQIPCVWGWSADGTEATCAPSKLLDTNAHYSVTLVTGALDTEGQGLTAPLALGFDTGLGGDKQPPTALLTEPAGGAKGVARNTTIKITFSEPMDKASVKAALKIVTPAVTGTVTWNAAGDQVTFDPQTDFSYGAAVSWTVLATARDLAGNALASDLVKTFTVVRQITTSIVAVKQLTGTADACNHIAAGDLIVGECLVADPFCPGFVCTGEYIYRTHTSVGYLDFDLGPLASAGATTINSALLYVYQVGIIFNPYGLLGGKVLAEHVNFGTSMDANDISSAAIKVCSPLPVPCQSSATLSTDAAAGYKSASVTAFVRDDFTNRQARGNRSQLRLRFPSSAGAQDDAEHDSATFLGVGAGVNEPYLKITYEQP